MYLWKYTWFLLLFHHAQAFPDLRRNMSLHDPADMGLDMTFLSPTTYVNLANDSKGMPDLKNFMKETDLETRRFTEWFPLLHWGSDKDIIYSCFYLQTIHRNSIRDIRRYFERRTLYKSTLEYEVGYLSHEVVWRYRMILELYHYVMEWYGLYPQRNFAPTMLVFYVYTNVVQQTTVIIHLCQMMHELEKKYRMPRERGVFDDYDAGKDVEQKQKTKTKFNRTIIDENLAAYEKYLRELKQDAKKKKKEMREMRKNVLKLGKTTTRGRPTAKKSKWPLDYGWSIEKW